ncbi:MAG: hypothetical protein QGH83_07160, partial [Candidatus Pacebacteria bacterium]|nr:hypothetical protein [Candidatus Paceibacterota bacterium]
DQGKNIIIQLRKVVSLRNSHTGVEFKNGKTLKVPVMTAVKALDKYAALRTSIQKGMFTGKLAKSPESFKAAIRESILDERSRGKRMPGKGIDLECMECGKKFTKQITRQMIDVRCPKCKGYDVEVAEGIKLNELNLTQKVMATIKDKGEPDRHGNSPLPDGNLLKYIEKVHGRQGLKIAKELLKGTHIRFNEELDEWTVSDVEIAMKKEYGKIDKEAIEKLKKVQYKGNVDRNDLVKAGHGKLHVESVELDEGKKGGTKWEYEDATGTKRIGVLDKFSDKGGSDITYFFKRVKDGKLDVVSGSRLKKAKIVREELELDEKKGQVAAYDKAGKLVGNFPDMKTAKKLKPNHTYKVKEELELNERDYRKEYDEYHAKPIQRERNAARLRARRMMEKIGKVKKFDKMDIHHRDNNPLNNEEENLEVTTQNWNRAEPRLREQFIVKWKKTTPARPGSSPGVDHTDSLKRRPFRSLRDAQKFLVTIEKEGMAGIIVQEDMTEAYGRMDGDWYVLVVQQRDGSREIVAKGSEADMKKAARKHGGLKPGKVFITLSRQGVGDKVLGIGEGYTDEKALAKHIKDELGSAGRRWRRNQTLTTQDIQTFVDDNLDNPHTVDQNELVKELKKLHVKVSESHVKEEAPANSAGAGAVAGIAPGEDPPGKLPLKDKVKRRKKRMVKSLGIETYLEGFTDDAALAKQIKQALGRNVHMNEINSYIQENLDNPHKVDQNEVAKQLKKLGVKVDGPPVRESSMQAAVKQISKDIANLPQLDEKRFTERDVVKAIKQTGGKWGWKDSNEPSVIITTDLPGKSAHLVVDLDTFKRKASSYFGYTEDGEEVEFKMREVIRIGQREGKEAELDEVKYPNYRGGSPYRAGKHDRFTGKEDRCQIRCGDAKTSEEVDIFLGYSQNRALDDIDTDAVHSAQGFIPGPIDVFGRDAGKVGQDVIKEFGKRVQVVFEETIAEGRAKPARQLINLDREVMIVKDNQVIVIDKRDQQKYEKQGWSLAERRDRPWRFAEEKETVPEAAVRYGTNWIVKMSTSRPGMDVLHYVLAQSAKEAKKKALALADKGSKVIDVMKEENVDEGEMPAKKSNAVGGKAEDPEAKKSEAIGPATEKKGKGAESAKKSKTKVTVPETEGYQSLEHAIKSVVTKK